MSGSEDSSARADEQLCPLRVTLLPSIGSAGLELVTRELRLDEVNEAQCTRLSDGKCSVELRSPPIGAPLYLLLNVTHPQLVLNVTLRLALVGTPYTKRGLSNVPAVMFSFTVYSLLSTSTGFSLASENSESLVSSQQLRSPVAISYSIRAA